MQTFDLMEAPMPIQRLNHAVLYIRDVGRSVGFYRGLLGFRVVTEVPSQAAFLQAPGSTNDHDLGLFAIGAAAPDSAAGRTVGLYHLAWEVDTLAELARLAAVLSDAGALVGASDHSTTKSLYAKDPDGLEFEVAWVVPARFLTSNDVESQGIAPLDIPAEIVRFGAETPGGIGISVPA
jgi:catechol-2,3-dioxygenase